MRWHERQSLDPLYYDSMENEAPIAAASIVSEEKQKQKETTV